MLNLIEQVSQLSRIDNLTLQQLQQEILSIKDEWTSVYSDYHSGGWQTLSLLNRTSNSTDTVIEDCHPVATTLLQRLPCAQAFLKSFGLDYMWVRLAKLQPNAFLWEHRDYQELKKTERLRLHIPIVTNRFSTMIVGDARIHLAAGYMWKLNPAHRHGAGNFGKEDRIHILIDCYMNDALKSLLRSETMEEAWLDKRLSPAPEVLSQIVRTAKELASLGYDTSAEHLLLKTFFCYQMKEGVGYDLISQMYEVLGDEDKKELWQAKKAEFLGVNR